MKKSPPTKRRRLTIRQQLSRRLKSIDMCGCPKCVKEVIAHLTYRTSVYIVIDKFGKNHRRFELLQKPIDFKKWIEGKKHA